MDKGKTDLKLLKKLQVNAPFLDLKNRYLPTFLKYGMNPEIGIDAEALDTTPDAEFESVAEILKTNNRKITLHGPFMDLVPGALDPMLLAATRRRFARFFEVVPIFEPVNVVCHTGYDPSHYRELWTEWLPLSVATWEPLVAQAERLGFKLLLENVYEKNSDVHAALFEERGLAPTTIATMLKKMEKKGVVDHRSEGRQYVYRPLVAEREVRRSMVAELIDRAFQGDAHALVNHLLEEKDLDPAEIKRLKTLIAEREKGKDKGHGK